METILTLTLNPSIDESVSVERIEEERKLRCSPPRYEPGGGGINISRVIRILGGRSTALFARGGPPGQILERALVEGGLDCRPIPISGWTRINFAVMERATNRQFRFNLPGPHLDGEAEPILELLERWDPAPGWLAASGSLPPGMPSDFYARLAQLARKRKIRLLVDGSGAALRSACEAGVSLLKPNLHELEELTGKSARSEPEQAEAAQTLIREKAAEAVAVSLGAAGALLAPPEGILRVKSPDVPVASRIGAGDSMAAGWLLALARGRPMAEAFRFGAAAGAATVMTPGTELCRRADVERLFEGM